MVTAPVHGGLAEPVNRYGNRLPVEALLSRPSVAVSSADCTTLHRIADGTLSPLTGPMNVDDYESVLERACIVRHGEAYAWTIPIFLPVDAEDAARIKVGDEVVLRDENSVAIGVLTVETIYERDLQRFLRIVYRTERTDHPGARLWTGDSRRFSLGGSLCMFEPAPDPRPFASYIKGPLQVRELIQHRGFEQTVAFQTRNPLHRAHEYALVHGAEQLLSARPERYTGVFLNPLVGELKSDDVPATVRMQTYINLVEQRVLGQGDQNEDVWKRAGQSLHEQLHLVGLDMRMFYAGPNEAVMHAIYRQNLGFTHFIVGRKHADAPYDDQTPIWDDFEAQRIFRSLGGKLAIEAIPVGYAAYFEELGRVGLVEEHPGMTPVSISGTKMRETLRAGRIPDSRVMRECVARVLIEYYRKDADDSATPEHVHL
jgi:sulfate adenylyltransferase